MIKGLFQPVPCASCRLVMPLSALEAIDHNIAEDQRHHGTEPIKMWTAQGPSLTGHLRNRCFKVNAARFVNVTAAAVI